MCLGWRGASVARAEAQATAEGGGTGTNSERGSLLAASFAVADFRPVAENGGGGERGDTIKLFRTGVGGFEDSAGSVA